MCDGGIPVIQKNTVCCAASCGECAGSGCSKRPSPEGFTGGEACCGSGVKATGRICSDTVGAPCVIEDGKSTDA